MCKPLVSVVWHYFDAPLLIRNSFLKRKQFLLAISSQYFISHCYISSAPTVFYLYKLIFLSIWFWNVLIMWCHFVCRFVAVTHGKSVQVWHAPGVMLEFAPFVLYRTFPAQYDDAVCVIWSDDSKWVNMLVTRFTLYTYWHFSKQWNFIFSCV